MRAAERSLWWTSDELPEALAAALGAPVTEAPVGTVPEGQTELWLRTLARCHELEVDPVSAPPVRLARGETLVLARTGTDGPTAWSLVVAAVRAHALVVGRDGRKHRVRLDELSAVVWRGDGDEESARWSEALAGAGIRAPDDDPAAGGGEGSAPAVVRAWRLRPASDLTIGVALSRWGVTRALAGLVVAHAAQYVLWIGSWWLLGWGALGGRLEPGWLVAWGLLLVSRLPFSAAANVFGGLAVLRFGSLLRRRLLAGASRLELGEIRRLGFGQLTGRLLEAASFETQVFHGGLLTLTATVELAMAAVVLGLGAGGALHVALLAGWLGLLGVAAARDLHARERWTRRRLELAQEVVERIAGHATRAIQLAPERWHEGEDEAAAALAAAVRRLDRVGAVPMAVLRRAWPVVGIAGLAPAVLAQPFDLAGVAVGLGGVLLAAASLGNLAGGLQRLAAARVAWRQLGDLVVVSPRPGTCDRAAPAGPGRLSARELVVQRGGRRILDGVELEVDPGEHVRVTGGCGSGKTSLAETLLALERPHGGLVTLDGLDPASLAAEWRERVGGTPEPGRDHLLGGSLAFNLLLGRRWPARAEDLEQARALCEALGLGDLIVRMPAGLHTQVGDAGWKLSHGERSRVFLARALLRTTQVLVLDSPGDGLDPGTSARVLEVLDRDRRGMVVLEARG